MKKIAFITIFILLIDQISKIYVKTHFHIGESIPIFGQDWARLTFVENPGMAYGLHFGGLLGKYILVILRVFLIVYMAVLFSKWLKQGVSNYRIIPLALIFAGAIGNLIDGIFYGMLFDTGTIFDEEMAYWIGYEGVSKIIPFGEGYSTLMKGCVVDMLHFPMVDYTLPQDFPIWGGKRIEFFKYIFNIADTAITIGGLSLFIFRKKAFPNGFDF